MGKHNSASSSARGSNRDSSGKIWEESSSETGSWWGTTSESEGALSPRSSLQFPHIPHRLLDLLANKCGPLLTVLASNSSLDDFKVATNLPNEMRPDNIYACLTGSKDKRDQMLRRLHDFASRIVQFSPDAISLAAVSFYIIWTYAEGNDKANSYAALLELQAKLSNAKSLRDFLDGEDQVQARESEQDFPREPILAARGSAPSNRVQWRGEFDLARASAPADFSQRNNYIKVDVAARLSDVFGIAPAINTNYVRPEIVVHMEQTVLPVIGHKYKIQNFFNALNSDMTAEEFEALLAEHNLSGVFAFGDSAADVYNALKLKSADEESRQVMVDKLLYSYSPVGARDSIALSPEVLDKYHAVFLDILWAFGNDVDKDRARLFLEKLYQRQSSKQRVSSARDSIARDVDFLRQAGLFPRSSSIGSVDFSAADKNARLNSAIVFLQNEYHFGSLPENFSEDDFAAAFATLPELVENGEQINLRVFCEQLKANPVFILGSLLQLAEDLFASDDMQTSAVLFYMVWACANSQDSRQQLPKERAGTALVQVGEALAEEIRLQELVSRTSARLSERAAVRASIEVASDDYAQANVAISYFRDNLDEDIFSSLTIDSIDDPRFMELLRSLSATLQCDLNKLYQELKENSRAFVLEFLSMAQPYVQDMKPAATLAYMAFAFARSNLEEGPYKVTAAQELARLRERAMQDEKPTAATSMWRSSEAAVSVAPLSLPADGADRPARQAVR